MPPIPDTPSPDFTQELPVAKVLEWLLAGMEPSGRETVPLHRALGRVLAVPLTATADQPPFAAAAMDGWAVRAADLAGANPQTPVSLTSFGEVAAGHPLAVALPAGHTARIFTGAPLPSGADAVVRQEDVRILAGTPSFAAPIAVGRYVRPAGRDFAAGTELLSAGARLNPQALGLAASADRAVLTVYRRPRVGILATGDEITPPGVPRAAGQIVSSNAIAIAALVERWGGKAVPLGIAADTPQGVLGRLEDAAGADPSGLDLVVTIGGTALGGYDVIGQLGRNGSGVRTVQVALRPCKTIVAGTLSGVRVLGVPGNPVPAAVGAITFLAPMLRALSGMRPTPCRLLPAELLGELPAAGLCRTLYLTKLNRMGAVLVAEALGGAKSGGAAMALTQADGVIIRYPGLPIAGDGDPVDVLTFDDAIGPD